MAAARTEKKKGNSRPVAPVETANASFEGFMPYLIAKLAWALNRALSDTEPDTRACQQIRQHTPPPDAGQLFRNPSASKASMTCGRAPTRSWNAHRLGHRVKSKLTCPAQLNTTNRYASATVNCSPIR